MWSHQPLDKAPPLQDVDIRGAWLNATVRGNNLGVDASPAADDMTPVNPTDIVAMTVGADFGGTNGYLRRAEAAWRPDEVGTLSAWVFCRDVTKGMCIFASSDEATDNYFLEWIITNAGVQYLYVLENGVVIGVVTGTTALAQNMWHHLAVTSDGSRYLLYANGQADTIAGGATDSGAWLADVSNRDNITIGGLRYNSGLILPYEGRIKDLRYYSRELSASRVAYEYQLGVPDDDLRLWLPGGDVDHTRFEWPLTHSGGVIVGHISQFDGTDDFIDCGALGNISQISLWIDPESTTEEILQIDAGKHITVSGGTVTYTGLTASATYVDGVVSTTLVADQWQHLVCQFAQDSAANFELGREGANYGEIDLWNIRAHDRLWSAAEVAIVEARERRAV